MNRLLHACRRHYAGSIRLLHWLVLLLGLCAAAIGLGFTELPRLLGVPLALGPLVLLGLDWHAHRQHYVSFQSNATVPVPAPLAPRQKIAIRATGLFESEDRVQSHTLLEGYYRTFPSREHAIIAISTPSTFLGWGSRAVDDGMWYIFCLPEAIRSVQLGHIRFGRQQMPGVALTRRASRPGTIRKKRARHFDSVAYLGCQNDRDALLVAGDLLHDARMDTE